MDLSAVGMQLLAQRSPWAWVVVFAAGVCSSLGPCASPRLVACSALVLRSRAPYLVGFAFVSGTVATYACLGASGAVVGDLVRDASWLYAAVALAALVGGLLTLIGGGSRAHDECARAPETTGVSAATLSGVGFALMVSPCCTPIVGAIMAYTTMRADALAGAGMLAAFGLGHAAPLLPVIAGGPAAAARMASSRWTDVARVGAGTCMIALGAYYALLI